MTLWHDAKKIADLIMYNIDGLEIVGSLFRKSEIVRDIDFTTMDDLQQIAIKMGQIFDNHIYMKTNGQNYVRFILKHDDGPVGIDFFKADDPYSYKYLKFLRKLEKGKAIYLKKLAKEKGLKLSTLGFFDGDRKIDMRPSHILSFLKSKKSYEDFISQKTYKYKDESIK